MEYTLSIDLKSFKRNYDEKKHQLVFLKTRIDDFDPLTVFMKISKELLQFCK